MPPLPHHCAAYLRVYEPLAAFPEQERAGWVDYAGTSGALPRAERLGAEHRSALAGVISMPPRPVPADETRDAFVLQADGALHVCPVQSRLRSWVALGQFRDGLPDSVLHAFVPPASLARADADHARWGEQQRAVPLRILTATWSVPVSWFVPFAPGDLLPGHTTEPDDAPDVVHRTRMSAARRRVARALRTIRTHLEEMDAMGELEVADDLEQLGRWLEEFHPRSWLELDLAGLARLLGTEEDTSVADVGSAVAALAEGDEEGAVLTYRTVVDRWAAVSAYEHAN